jgi:predicted membrane protein
VRSGRTTGAIILFIGALFSIEFFLWPRMNVWRWWPLAIVFFGLIIISRAVRGAREHGGLEFTAGAGAASGSRTEPTVSEVAVWSGIERRVASPNFRRADLTAVMGGIELDLRQAGTGPEPAVIDVFVMMGGVEITVPPDWAVTNQISAFMGGVEDKSTGTQQARHRLIVTGVAIMGGVEIKT